MGCRRRQVFFFLFLIFFFPTLASTATTKGSSNASAQAAITEEEKDEGVESVMLRKTPLGSRPPSCEGRCGSSCGRRCEAVQVPVSPHELLLLLRVRRKRETLTAMGVGSGGNHGGGGVVLPSSYDDHSNYKPLGWRCKCLHS